MQEEFNPPLKLHTIYPVTKKNCNEGNLDRITKRTLRATSPGAEKENEDTRKREQSVCQCYEAVKKCFLLNKLWMG
jgi:hypothetical protein